MKKMIFVLVAVVMTVSALIVAGCSSVENPPDQVTVQLKWVHSIQFGGMYTADKKGFYTDENIAVTFNTGGPDIDGTQVCYL